MSFQRIPGSNPSPLLVLMSCNSRLQIVPVIICFKRPQKSPISFHACLDLRSIPACASAYPRLAAGRRGSRASCVYPCPATFFRGNLSCGAPFRGNLSRGAPFRGNLSCGAPFRGNLSRGVLPRDRGESSSPSPCSPVLNYSFLYRTFQSRIPRIDE